MSETEQIILNSKPIEQIKYQNYFTFLAIMLFYFFESMQMSYFNVLAPSFLSHGIYQQNQIAGLSAAYYYGDMIGLLPVGFALDYFSLRKVLLWAIFGSVVSAFMLLLSPCYELEWLARFLCGFFGGTFSFVGGIRLITMLFPHRFTFFMGIFLAAGMFGGFMSQYPLLITVNHFGTQGTMLVMACFGIIVGLFNWLYLHPKEVPPNAKQKNNYCGTFKQMCLEIVTNLRNWIDCLMVVLLDTPVSIIGTLWGVVMLMSLYHFSDGVSAWIVMSLFIGLTIGLPIMGAVADRYNYPAWLIFLGAAISGLMIITMLIFQHLNPVVVAILFFGLGFFSSCQTLGFTWLTKSMKPELIGRNSAFNSMIFMGSNGIIKQICASLLLTPALLKQHTSASNLLLFMGCGMFVVAIYVCLRKKLFKLT